MAPIDFFLGVPRQAFDTQVATRMLVVRQYADTVRGLSSARLHDSQHLSFDAIMNLKKLTLILISIYTGLIATACVERYLSSLARHGTIQWIHLIYPIKIILLSVSLYVYFYLKKNTDLSKDNFWIDLIKLSPARLSILLASSIFAFSQYTLAHIFLWPIKILIFRW